MANSPARKAARKARHSSPSPVRAKKTRSPLSPVKKAKKSNLRLLTGDDEQDIKRCLQQVEGSHVAEYDYFLPPQVDYSRERSKEDPRNGRRALYVTFKCKTCNAEVPRATNDSSPGNLRTHIGACQERYRQEKLNKVLEEFGYGGKEAPPSETRQCTAIVCAVECFPLSAFEKVTLKPICSKAMRENMPSHKVVSEAVTILARLGKTALIECLKNVKGGIYILHDEWTSPTHVGFMALVACFLETCGGETKLVTMPLKIVPFIGSHSGANIAALIESKLVEYGIDDRVMGIGSDNASACEKAVEELGRVGRLDKQKTWVRCFAHTINLLMGAMLKSFALKPYKGGQAAPTEDDDDNDNRPAELAVAEERDVILPLRAYTTAFSPSSPDVIPDGRLLPKSVSALQQAHRAALLAEWAHRWRTSATGASLRRVNPRPPGPAFSRPFVDLGARRFWLAEGDEGKMCEQCGKEETREHVVLECEAYKEARGELRREAGISGFLYGWDTAVVGGALANIGDALGHELNHVEEEWAVASLSAGGIVGTFVGGIFSDKIGRKKVLMIGDALFTLGGILIAASYSLPQFVVGRVAKGGGAGIATIVGAVYLGEVAPSYHRGRLISVQSIMITAGQLIAYAVSAGLEDVNHGWRILFALSLPFSIGQGIAMHWLPESPRFAVISGRADLARGALSRIYAQATPEQLDLKLKAISLAAEASDALRKTHPSLLARLSIVVTTPRYIRCVTCAAVIFLGQQLSGWNSFLYYSSTIFGATGFSNTSSIGVLISGINAIFTILSMFTLDRLGRRRWLLLGLPTMIVALIIAAVAFHYMTQSTGGMLVDGADYPMRWVGLMIGMMCLFIVGYAPSLGTLAYSTVELIPLEVRGIGSAMGVTFQWIGNLIISATFLTMLNGIGPSGAYGVFAGLCAATLLFVIFCYPESSGLSLEQTGLLFTDGFGVRKAEIMRKSTRFAEQQGGSSPNEDPVVGLRNLESRLEGSRV
ncbi:hypothetical protein JCM6882_008668 [Rhodosporidiobolus microsporus]